MYSSFHKVNRVYYCQAWARHQVYSFWYNEQDTDPIHSLMGTIDTWRRDLQRIWHLNKPLRMTKPNTGKKNMGKDSGARRSSACLGNSIVQSCGCAGQMGGTARGGLEEGSLHSVTQERHMPHVHWRGVILVVLWTWDPGCTKCGEAEKGVKDITRRNLLLWLPSYLWGKKHSPFA